MMVVPIVEGILEAVPKEMEWGLEQLEIVGRIRHYCKN